MHMRSRLEALIDEMLEGRLLLEEAVGEFEKLYIQKALQKHQQHRDCAQAVDIGTMLTWADFHITPETNREPRQSRLTATANAPPNDRKVFSLTTRRPAPAPLVCVRRREGGA